MPTTEDTDHCAKIRELNDAFRTSLSGGKVMLTAGVSDLPEDIRTTALQRMVAFDAFDADNDPHREHDFGAFDVADHKFFWKIDYYDKDLRYGSENPADPDVTTRVLTLMLASEY